mmetsp:Transcript_60355/g.160691  ORF Transcript_60355/g.160691 Transcript_60355/m.160691 type:complete len:141 (+) Transcript_60355:4135-4557(+)
MQKFASSETTCVDGSVCDPVIAFDAKEDDTSDPVFAWIAVLVDASEIAFSLEVLVDDTDPISPKLGWASVLLLLLVTFMSIFIFNEWTAKVDPCALPDAGSIVTLAILNVLSSEVHNPKPRSRACFFSSENPAKKQISFS